MIGIKKQSQALIQSRFAWNYIVGLKVFVQIKNTCNSSDLFELLPFLHIRLPPVKRDPYYICYFFPGDVPFFPSAGGTVFLCYYSYSIGSRTGE